MRIIAGQYKGRRLFSPNDNNIRPTTDRVKETIFNILFSKNRLNGTVLDLFCGSGALGLEALSRGATHCSFVDKEKQSIVLTQKNIDKIGIQNCSVMQNDAHFMLKHFAKMGTKFDLILLDPPYNGAYEARLLDAIFENQILNHQGLVVLETSTDTKLSTTNPIYQMIDTRKLGATTISFFEYNAN